MAESNQLNHAWLAFLANPHHDGTTQQIDDFLQPYPGSKIVLINGAKIQKPFATPIGVEFVINRGSIE
ncbi:MAG: hypothetical protein J6V92_02125 [Bacteroidaceae bacterium]|nr:hypothetical protein [Bacteroidaceae bacterium]